MQSGSLVDHRKIHSIEVDGLCAVEALMLIHRRRDFAMRRLHISGDGEMPD
jgi:hypothetical protein